MGVYNPLAKMPSSCDACENWQMERCDLYVHYDKFMEARHPGCPLVEVKAPHGRLVDADALEQDAQKRMLICNQNDNQFQKPYEVMRAIALAPTIIPAEEG